MSSGTIKRYSGKGDCSYDKTSDSAPADGFSGVECAHSASQSPDRQLHNANVLYHLMDGADAV